MTLSAGITLEEAIRQSEFFSQGVNVWITETNAISANIPREYKFKSIQVAWGDLYCGYNAAIELHDPSGKLFPILYLNKSNGHFPTLEELKNSYPQIFKVKGKFGDAF